jgi:cytoskeletal protein CcmA (bactofilin family)
MWKKSDFIPESSSGGSPEAPTQTGAAPMRAGSAIGSTATIGTSITIRGDLSGEEDLLVRGRVEGTINLPQNRVTVGEEGRVNASVFARSITVEGEVEGDMHGEEQVVVRRSGRVRGNIASPRVTLEDGCRFKGSIDMDGKPAGAQAAKPSLARTDQAAATETGNGQQPPKSVPAQPNPSAGGKSASSAAAKA